MAVHSVRAVKEQTGNGRSRMTRDELIDRLRHLLRALGWQ